MKTLLKEVLRLPVHLEDDDAKLLYSSMHGHAARGSGVTIRAIAEVSYQDGDQTMFHGTIRFDDNKDTTQRTAIVAWPLDNARPAPWTNDHVGNEEIILFWTASARPGGNLGLCAHNLNAIEHLVKAHLVCEVVFSQNTRWWAFTWIELGKALPSLFRTFPSVHEAAGATGVLLGVELGEVSVSQQSDLQKLLGGYSFFDGTLGMVSLLMLILLINGLFGVYLTDEEGSVLLIVLTIAVVALLHEEATWPWIFSRIIRCARIDTPIERVNKLKHVKYTDAPFSGQAILSAGLGFLVLWMDIGSEEHIIRTATFRVAASSFAAVMTGVLLLNMVQAVLTAPADTETPECWVKTSITTLYVPLKPVAEKDTRCSAADKFSMATSGFAAVSGLLRRKGVRVRLRSDDSPHQHDGTLTLSNGFEQELVFTVKSSTKAEPASTTTTSFVDILDVTLVDEEEDGVFCSTSVIEGTGFSFACSDHAGNLSGPEATKLVALVIKDELLNLQQQQERAAPSARRGMNSGVGFRRLLEPIGLLHEYYEAFRSAGIDSEDLSVVTREDLMELVGVTDRRHQIKILAQIKRCYPDNSRCCCRRQGNTSAGSELAGQAASIVGGVIGNLI
eukprot:g7523.t1